MKKIKKAFTLVELIIVITILAILWTIWFMSYQWYKTDSRNSARISDIDSLETALNLYKIDVWNYPIPTDWVAITYSWSEVWTQWTIWDSVISVLNNRINKKPIDPLTNTEYTYSRLNTKNEFQIWTILEWWETAYNPMIEKIYANGTKITNAYIKWNYNWLVAKTSTWNIMYIFALPSIISSELWTPTIEEIITNKKLVYKWYKNLPSSYKNTDYKTDGWFEYIPNSVIVYSWAVDNLNDITVQAKLMKSIQWAYSWTILMEDASDVKTVVQEISKSETLTDSIVLIAWSVIKDNLNLDEIRTYER